MRTIFSFLTIALLALGGQAEAELVFGGNSLASRGPATYSFTYTVSAMQDSQITSFNLPFDVTDGVTFSNFSVNPVFAQSSSTPLTAPFVADVGLAGSVGLLAIGAGETADLFTIDLTVGFDPGTGNVVLAEPVTTGFDSNFVQVTDENNAAIPLSELRFTQGFTLISAVPEPSAFVLLGVASGLCVMRRRRRVP